ncbi:hypothetical protein MHU86_25300 [Fragilaria crotonensis]|nr:hypothetical protein MHU86_25300 [Fragilaria crotonensis]
MTKKVDILLKVEEFSSNGTLATREARLRKINTKSTTSGELKEMARSHLNIQRDLDLELWLLHDDGASPMNLRDMDKISKLITKDSTIQVEKLDARNQHDYPSSAFVPRYASLTKPPSAAFAAEENQRSDEEMARLLSLQINGTRHNRSQLMRMSPSRPLGDMIAEANFSQYAIEGGRSACTSICSMPQHSC